MQAALAPRGIVVLCALALVGAMAGCGGSSPSTTHASRTPTKTATSALPLAVKLRQSIAACRKQVAKSQFILPSEQSIAEAACNGMKTGHLGPLLAILRRSCERAVATLPTAKQPPALMACKKVYR